MEAVPSDWTFEDAERFLRDALEMSEEEFRLVIKAAGDDPDEVFAQFGTAVEAAIIRARGQ